MGLKTLILEQIILTVAILLSTLEIMEKEV